MKVAIVFILFSLLLSGCSSINPLDSTVSSLKEDMTYDHFQNFYTAENLYEMTAVYLVDSVTGEKTLMFDFEEKGGPDVDFSSVRNEFVYATVDGQLYLYSVEDEHSEAIVSSDGTLENLKRINVPHFSPDGQYVAFWAFGTAKLSELFVIDLASLKVDRITASSGAELYNPSYNWSSKNDLVMPRGNRTGYAQPWGFFYTHSGNLGNTTNLFNAEQMQQLNNRSIDLLSEAFFKSDHEIVYAYRNNGGTYVCKHDLETNIQSSYFFGDDSLWLLGVNETHIFYQVMREDFGKQLLTYDETDQSHTELIKDDDKFNYFFLQNLPDDNVMVFLKSEVLPEGAEEEMQTPRQELLFLDTGSEKPLILPEYVLDQGQQIDFLGIASE